jgi:hypothetical protein
LEPANKWLAVYAAKLKERLRASMPDLVDELVDQDILGMQMVRIWVFIPPVYAVSTCTPPITSGFLTGYRRFKGLVG